MRSCREGWGTRRELRGREGLVAQTLLSVHFTSWLETKSTGRSACATQIAENLELEDVADFRVDGEVRRGDAVDVVLLAVAFGEIEVAADVVVLVVVSEELFGFGFAEAECRQRDGDAKPTGEGFVFGDQLLEGHDRCATRFGGHF